MKLFLRHLRNPDPSTFFNWDIVQIGKKDFFRIVPGWVQMLKNILLFLFWVAWTALLSYLVFGAAAARADTPTIQVFTKSPPPSYSYVPSVLKDSSKVRMYWCGSNSSYPGDHIFYAESGSVSGPFSAKGSSVPNTFTVSLSPSSSGFDSVHVCDPSLIRFSDGTRWLYYSGATSSPGVRTAIGAVFSANGITGFSRANSGNPIFAVSPQVTALSPALNGYGTGQPSAFIRNGEVYLAYTDTFGKGSNPGNGAGIYVVRSADPVFQSGVEALGRDGFQLLENLYGRPESYERYLLRTRRILLEGFSASWAYSPETNKIVVAQHQVQNQVELYTFDADTFAQLSHTSQPYTKSWVDGPAILKNERGEVVCPLTIYGSFGDSVWTSQLGLQEANICP